MCVKFAGVDPEEEEEEEELVVKAMISSNVSEERIMCVEFED